MIKASNDGLPASVRQAMDANYKRRSFTDEDSSHIAALPGVPDSDRSRVGKFMRADGWQRSMHSRASGLSAMCLLSSYKRRFVFGIDQHSGSPN
jgi:hypothetical protein